MGTMIKLLFLLIKFINTQFLVCKKAKQIEENFFSSNYVKSNIDIAIAT